MPDVPDPAPESLRSLREEMAIGFHEVNPPTAAVAHLSSEPALGE